jgi:hypothetical protein
VGRRYSVLDLYLLQSHAEPDLESLEAAVKTQSASSSAG